MKTLAILILFLISLLVLSVRLSDGSIGYVSLPVVGLNKNVCLIKD